MEKLIRLTKWVEYHGVPSEKSLRYFVVNARSNGFDKVMKKIDKKIFIDETEFFKWYEEYKKLTTTRQPKVPTEIMSRLDLVSEFEKGSDTTFFTQDYVAAVICCGPANLERMRWLKIGPPFKRLGRRCLYLKKDICDWINSTAKNGVEPKK